MISTKQTIALHTIVIVATLTISAVPSPHAYAVSAQNNRCVSTQTLSTGGTITTTITCGSNGAFPLPPGQGGTPHGQDIRSTCTTADIKCSGSVTGFGTSPKP
jgi:hypothetical protein